MPFHLRSKLASVFHTSSHGGLDRQVQVAYFPNWSIYQKGYKPEHVPVQHLTHILYAFANIKDNGEVVLSDEWADRQIKYDGDQEQDVAMFGNLNQFLQLKKQHRHLKTLLSIGGWSYSSSFCGMNDAAKRQTFIASAVKLLADCGFDGLDIDWEYPQSDAEAQAYVELLSGLRHALDVYGQRATPNDPHYLLTIAAPCSPQQYQILKLKDMDRYLDFWNLMAYDFSGSWDQVANHQANLYGGAISVSKAVDDYKHRGVPLSKMVLGIPAYGRGFVGTGGPGQPYRHASETEGGTYLYKDLPRQNAQEHFNKRAGASWSHDGSEFISYDSPEAVRAKAAYIKDKGMLGAMFWELSGDVPADQDRSLVRTMAHVLGHLDQSQNHIAYPESVHPNVRD